MTDWADTARAALVREPTALVTILATEGSAPRGAGARMVVTADALHGTIGGGALEYRVAEQARAILDLPPGSWRVQDYPLGPLLGQCCGGRVRLLVERLDAVITAMEAALTAEGLFVVEYGSGKCRDPSRGATVPGLPGRSCGWRKFRRPGGGLSLRLHPPRADSGPGR